jgi:hypothetical protein
MMQLADLKNKTALELANNWPVIFYAAGASVVEKYFNEYILQLIQKYCTVFLFHIP